MMQSWFPNAKFGIFIHWGIYAVKGVPESWSWFSGQLTKDEYFDQLSGFTASNYDPNEWAEVFAASGAQYAVLTSKHHDGVALWPTQQSKLNVKDSTPADRDLLGPFISALREHQLKVGLYFSHLDWAHPDYATIHHANDPKKGKPGLSYPLPKSGGTAGEEDPARWQSFLNFHRNQLEELCTQYGKLDLLWFDGEWERTAEQWKMKDVREALVKWQPECIFNARLLGYGDYNTPEQGLPTRPPSGNWEFCCTLNDSWGYQVQDHNHKSLRDILRLFLESISMGGNFLMSVGPTADGALQPEQITRLRELGAWIGPRKEAIYGTRKGLEPGLYNGPSTLSADGKSLYLFNFDRPSELVVRGIHNRSAKATLLNQSSASLKVTRKYGTDDWAPEESVPSMTFIELPEGACDETCTVVKLEFDEPVRQYVGTGRL